MPPSARRATELRVGGQRDGDLEVGFLAVGEMRGQALGFSRRVRPASSALARSAIQRVDARS